MVEDSFCQKAKAALREISPRRGCCRKTDKLISAALEGNADYKAALSCADRFLCDECRDVYLRRLFIKFGTVTDPAKSYHLEMSFPNEALRDKTADLLDSMNLAVKRGRRRDNFTVYFKNSETISDFLASVGASDAVFYMINLKLMKEATISINRQNNFETANMQKTVSANIAYISAVNYLIESGNFDSLPEDIKQTARLRVENDTSSMAELGRMHSPSISKSGVKHRLDKLVEIADDIKSRNKK